MSYVDFQAIEFADDKMKKVQDLLPAVKSSCANVLITGAPGIGKSSLAKYILGNNFEALTRFNQPLQRSCLLENVDQLGLEDQKQLLELLESMPEEARPRVVSTSRVSLKSLVQSGQFREDLYYKLTVLHMDLPALSKRVGDIEVIAKYLVSIFGIIHRKTEVALSNEAIQKLNAWSWPGNVRELENVLERAVIISANNAISANDIVIENKESITDSSFYTGMTLSQVEQKLILQTLKLTEQNRTRAAEILGISIRTLRNKINEYKQAGVA